MSENIIVKYGSEVVSDSIYDYAEKVVLDRITPDLSGLKPVHKKILWAGLNAKLTPDKIFKKSTTLVSETLKYHSHGDSAAYGALVRLGQPWKQNACLIDFNGNNGSFFDSTSFAAYRYTYSRLTETAMMMLDGINKNAVDIIPSENDSEYLEPVILPSKFPNLLVNGSMGLGFGINANHLPHDVNRVVDTINAFIENEEISEKELFSLIGGPSFPNKCTIMNGSELENIYSTGVGRVVMRGDYHIEDNSIIFTSLPYNIDVEPVLVSLEELGEKNLLPDVKAFINASSEKDGVKLIFELEKNAEPSKTLAVLFAKTNLKSTFPVSQYVLIDGKPTLLSLKGIIKEYINHLRTCLVRETKFDCDKKENELHINEGYMIILNDIDKAIEIIKKSLNKEMAKIELINFFGLSDIQAIKILELRLARLTNMEVDKIKKEIEDLKSEITILKKIISDRTIQGTIIEKNLSSFKNKNIIELSIVDEVTEKNEAFVETKEVYVILTDDGVGVVNHEEKIKKSNKKILSQQKCLSTDTIYFVSKDGKLRKDKVHELLDYSNINLSSTIENCVGFFTTATDYVSYVTEMGVIRTFNVADYDKKRISSFTKLKTNDTIVDLCNTNGVALVITEDGNKIFSNQTGEKTVVGSIICNGKPVSICSESEEYILITSDNRIRKIEIETSLSFNKTKGTIVSGKTNENEMVVKVYSNTDKLIVEDKIILSDDLSNRYRKM